MAGEGVTVFVTTHYMEEAEYCNRLALIFRGKIVALGTPTQLKQSSMKGELLLVECAPLGNAWKFCNRRPACSTRLFLAMRCISWCGMRALRRPQLGVSQGTWRCCNPH